MKQLKIILAGGSGFIGQGLLEYFGREHQIMVLSRQGMGESNNSYRASLLTAAQGYHVTYRRWDGRNLEKSWTQELEGADILVNLSGQSVNCRYSEENQKRILESRTFPTLALGQAIQQAVHPPKLWINASSATIYRHATDHAQDERGGEIENDFSVAVCKAWEKTFFDQRSPFTRKIAFRMAITLGRGGVLVPYLKLVRSGLGGKQGNGQQMFSWVHLEDIARAIRWVYDHPELEGVYNLAAPGPVTNDFFMESLRSRAGISWGLGAPAWLLKIAARLIGTETELLLKSRWVLPAKLLETGFEFRYPDLEKALQQILTQWEATPHGILSRGRKKWSTHYFTK